MLEFALIIILLPDLESPKYYIREHAEIKIIQLNNKYDFREILEVYSQQSNDNHVQLIIEKIINRYTEIGEFPTKDFSNFAKSVEQQNEYYQQVTWCYDLYRNSNGISENEGGEDNCVEIMTDIMYSYINFYLKNNGNRQKILEFLTKGN